MNAYRRMMAYWNRKVKKFDIYDVKFAQMAAMCFALVLAKLVPQILDVSIWWFVGLGALVGLKPFYTVFLKPDPFANG